MCIQNIYTVYIENQTIIFVLILIFVVILSQIMFLKRLFDNTYKVFVSLSGKNSYIYMPCVEVQNVLINVTFFTRSVYPKIMFGFIIKKIRESRNLSQEYMAAQLNITQAAYSKLESDKTHLSIKKLFEICRLLGIKETDILNHDARSFSLPEQGASSERFIPVEEYIGFLKRLIDAYEQDNIYLRLTNERLLSLIERKSRKTANN